MMNKSRKTVLFFLNIILAILILSFAASAKDSQKEMPITLSNVSSGVHIDWKNVKGATSYKIYRKNSENKKTTVVATVKKSAYTDTEVKNGTRYTYSVKPVLKNTKEDQISKAKEITRLGRPKIIKSSNSVKGITLSWSASEGATSYRIYRKADDYRWKLIGKTNASTLTFTDKKARSEYNYRYMVKGCNKDCSSYRSNYLKTDFIPSPEITKVASNKKSITISWEKVNKADVYRVYRSKPGETDTYYYASVDSSKTSLTDKNAKLGQKYSYTVRAVDKNGKPSGKRAAVDCVLMQAPVIKKAVNATGGVKLTWTKVPSAESYNLYRRESSDSVWKKVLNTKKLSATDIGR